MKLKRKEIGVSIFLFAFAILCVIGFHVTSDKIYNPSLTGENQIIEAETVKEIDSSTEIYYLDLKQIDETNNTLLFYTNHQEVFVYIEDELVYSLEKSDSIFGRTTGAMWNVVTLPAEDVQVQVKIIQVYPELTKQIPVFELGNAVSIYGSIMDGAAIELILSASIVIIGIALLLYWIAVFYKENRQREILYLGFFAIVFGIWNVGETQFAVFMFENRVFFSYLAFTCLMAMCLPALFFIKEFLEVEDKFIYKIFAAYIVLETIIGQLLHFTGIAGLKQTANFTVLSIVLVLIYLFYAIVQAIIEGRSIRKVTVNIIGLVVLVVTAVVDIRSYYSNVLTAEKIAKIGFLFYAIILGLETTRVARERLQEEQKMELLKEMAVKDMLTGCFNRNAYAEDVSEMTTPLGVQVITFDLNDLKRCNDTKGHKAGDIYISEAANMIGRIFGGLGRIYRIGGDEFCIITRGLLESQFMQRKENLKRAVGHYLLDYPDSGFGIACGYASYDPEVDESIEDTRHRADLSMYENKKEIKE